MKNNATYLLIVSFLCFHSIARSQCINCTDSVQANNNLVLCYPFNGNANDESGNGHTGVTTGVSAADDRFGNPNTSYSFNGSSNYITATHAPDLSFGNTSTFSIGFWFKATSAASFTSIITKSEESDTSGYAIGFDNTGKFRFISNLHYEVKTKATIPLNTWQFYYVTFNTRNDVRVYVNGLLDTAGSVNWLSANTRDIKLGRLYTTKTGYFFNGSIDDMRIYNRVLSPSEILDFYVCTNSNTGIKKLLSEDEKGIIIYPNPLRGSVLKIKMNSSVESNILIDIYDVTGKKIKSVDATNTIYKGNGILEVDGLDFDKGVYYVSICSGDNITREILVVE